MIIDKQKEELAAELKGSLLEFTRFFFKHLTKRDFIIGSPIGREPHQITICRALTKVLRIEVSNNQIINVPPGYGKSVLVSMWVAWSLAQHPDSNFLYISYSHDLAAKHTLFIKNIMMTQAYQYLFGVSLKTDSRARDHFTTIQGGTVAAFGSGGAITGQDAGLPALERFSGAVIIDDPLKPDAAHSETIRGTVNRNYAETIRQRTRGINVPIIFIGQRLHEDDLAHFLLSGKDIKAWDSIVLKALDEAGNALYPEVTTKETLLALQEKSPYVFSSQYQQNPIPAGGALFKREWFEILYEEPDITMTFITADTAETNKNYNDATVFSFWGLYEIETMGRKTGDLGLHWIDCHELRVEPKDIKDSFLDFWQECMTYKIPPFLAAIEKKSTGVTLLSVLKELRGMQIRDVKRTKASENKTDRFLEMQSLVASKFISFNIAARHKELCIKHMLKITANNSHRHDDIADTLYDAIKIALIDKSLDVSHKDINKADDVMDKLAQNMRKNQNLRMNRNAIY